MSWFDRQAAGDAEAFFRRLSAALDAAGVVSAMDTACGPYGLRRFVARAEVREGRVKLGPVDSLPLPKGGGPPSAAAWAAGTPSLEASLTRFRRSLPPAAWFTEIAIGVVRSAEGPLDLSLRIDEDAPALRPTALSMPTGAPHPCEDPAYLRALSGWGPRLDAMRANFSLARGEWSLVDGRFDDGHRRGPAVALATWHPAQRRFDWLLDAPAAEEAPFVEPVLTLDQSGAIELACFAALRMGAAGVVQGTLETRVIVYLATRFSLGGS
jgi:hypothetical protein